MNLPEIAGSAVEFGASMFEFALLEGEAVRVAAFHEHQILDDVPDFVIEAATVQVRFTGLGVKGASGFQDGGLQLIL